MGAGGPSPEGAPGGGSPTPGGSREQTARTTPRGRVTLAEAKQVFRGLRKIKGDIYLGGDIVSVGYTDSAIDVWLTDPNDGSAVISQTPYGAQKRLVLHPLKGRMPEEPLVNVTPPKEQPAEEGV